MGALILKRILILSDLHCGSQFGLLPPDYYNKERDLTLHQSKIQDFLWDHWMQMIKDVGTVDKVICNGDIIDGTNYKGQGKDLLTTDVYVQCDIAKTCLNMIKCNEFIFTQGSGYHVGHNISADEVLCNMMGGKWYGYFGDLIIDNITMNVMHWGSYSKRSGSRFNSQQVMVNELLLEDTSADIFIRSHTHYFAFSGTSKSLVVNTPCWKGLDGHCSVTSQQRPDNGYVLFNINGADYSWDHVVFKVPRQLFVNQVKV